MNSKIHRCGCFRRSLGIAPNGEGLTIVAHDKRKPFTPHKLNEV